MVFAVTLLLGSLSLSTASDRAVDLRSLVKDPAFGSFSMNPSGSHLAFVAPTVEGFRNIFVLDLDSLQGRLITGESANVIEFFWANDTRLLYRTDGANRVYGGFYAVNSDGSDIRTLVEPLTGGDRVYRYTAVIHRLPQDDEHVLVINNRNRQRYPDVYRLNILNGRMMLKLRNREEIRRFFPDREGQVRIGFEYEEFGQSKVLFRDRDSEEWEDLFSLDDDARFVEPAGFDSDSDSLIVFSNIDRDKGALYRFDLKTREFELLHEDPVYDLGGSFGASSSARFDLDSGELLGVSYHRDRFVTKWFDDEMDSIQRRIDAALANRVNVIVQIRRDVGRYLVESYSDVQPPQFFLLDLEQGRLEFVADRFPDLNEIDLGTEKHIEFTARDGTPVQGYLTLPPGYEAGTRIPLIALPHGGPWARDTWGFRSPFDAMHQLPALRGYAVLRVNFRGSTGFGYEFLTKSFRNIRSMNEDVMDGIDWAISEGYADPDALAIMGASWGGYATMWALANYPDRFLFGVNIFGVVDLVRHMNDYRHTWDRPEAYDFWVRRIGDPSDPAQRRVLEEESPINKIDKVRGPVLIYHGVRDINVNIDQSRRLRRALRRAGVEHVWIARADEAHSVQNEEDRIYVFEEIDKLLRRFYEQWSSKQ